MEDTTQESTAESTPTPAGSLAPMRKWAGLAIAGVAIAIGGFGVGYAVHGNEAGANTNQFGPGGFNGGNGQMPFAPPSANQGPGQMPPDPWSSSPRDGNDTNRGGNTGSNGRTTASSSGGRTI